MADMGLGTPLALGGEAGGEAIIVVGDGNAAGCCGGCARSLCPTFRKLPARGRPKLIWLLPAGASCS